MFSFAKLEKLDYRLCKAGLDLEFLCKCKDNKVAFEFLNLRSANNHLKYSSTYKECQSILLSEKIRQKNLQYEIYRKNLTHSKLLYQMSLI